MTTIVPGQYYFSVICTQCGATIAVREDPGDGKGRFLGPCAMRLRCSACGTEAEYAAAAVKSVGPSQPK